jgi:hypothetical protein
LGLSAAQIALQVPETDQHIAAQEDALGRRDGRQQSRLWVAKEFVTSYTRLGETKGLACLSKAVEKRATASHWKSESIPFSTCCAEIRVLKKSSPPSRQKGN